MNDGEGTGSKGAEGLDLLLLFKPSSVLSLVLWNQITLKGFFLKDVKKKRKKNYIETEMKTLIMTMEMHSSRMNIKELFQYDMLTFSLSISSFPPVCCRSRFRPLPHSQIRPSQLHPIPVEL